MKTQLAVLLLALLGIGGSAFGQGVVVNPKTVLGTINGTTRPIASATITVCAAGSAGLPCAPALAGVLFTNAALTNPLSNPFTADANGNYNFAIAAGTYTVTETASGFTGYSYQMSVTCAPGGACSFSAITASGLITANGGITGAGTIGTLGLGSGALNANNAFTGTNTLSNENAQFFVDGVKYSGCAAAIAAASALGTGTTVTIPGTGPIVECPFSDTTETIIRRNYDRTRDQCNGVVGGALPPCNAENYNYDDGNVMAGRRYEFTTSHQDLNGISLGLYSITTLKNATANGSSGADGFSAECDTAGTLSGTFSTCQAHEANVSIQSNGGSFGTATAVIGAVGTFQSAATCLIATTCTQVTTAIGVYGYGLRDNSTGAHPTNAYGGYFRAQSYGATRNYSAAFENKALLVFVNSTAAIDAEDSAHVARPFLFVDSSNGANLQAVSATGTFFENSAGGLLFSLVGGRANFSSVPVPNLAGNFDIGTTALPWGNLWLGTAATNNFKFQPAATAAARVISMPDPLGNVNMPYVIASGTATFTTTAAATLTCQTTVTVAATGALTTDAIEIAYASAPTGTTDGLLILSKWVTAGNVNFARCNPTAGSITPTALVLNWRVIR